LPNPRMDGPTVAAWFGNAQPPPIQSCDHLVNRTAGLALDVRARGDQRLDLGLQRVHIHTPRDLGAPLRPPRSMGIAFGIREGAESVELNDSRPSLRRFRAENSG
jgi:hypothetical protein